MLDGARFLARSTAVPTALALALLAGAALAGCGDDKPRDRPPDNRAARGPAGVAPATAQQAQLDPATLAGRTPPKGPKPVDPYDNIVGVKTDDLADQAAAAPEKPRDYPAELLSAVRGAESCVKPRLATEALPSEVDVALEGLVLESGTVVSGSARAAVLTPEELECVKRRLESARIPGGVKDAPLRVSTSLKLTFQRQGPAAPAPAAPAPAPATPNTY